MAGEATPDFSQILGSLMANPEAISGIMNVLKTNGIRVEKPEAAEFREKPTEETTKEESIEESEEEAVPASSKARHIPGKKEREHLLRALLPYLSDKKQARLEQLIRMADMMEIFGKIGGK